MQVGVELADGRIVPVLNGGGARGNALFTTTANGQTRALFQVYCRTRPAGPGAPSPGAGGTGTGRCGAEGSWRFVHGLMIEGIPPAPAGEPELRLTVWRDPAGLVKMSIRESLSGLHSGEISLHEPLPGSVPGKHAGTRCGITAGMSPQPSPGASPGTGTAGSVALRESAGEPGSTWRSRGGLPVAAVLIGLCAVAAVLFLLLRAGERTSPVGRPLTGERAAPAEKARTGVETALAAQSRAAEETPGAEEARAGARPGRTGAGDEAGGEQQERLRREEPPGDPSAGQEARVEASPGASPGNSAGGGAAEAYRIRPGDTMWDLSGRFYGDPMLYPSLARYNRIFNPDLIISGDSLLLPPRVEDRERR